MSEREGETKRDREGERVKQLFYGITVCYNIAVVVVLLFYVHSKQLWSCRDNQLT